MPRNKRYSKRQVRQVLWSYVFLTPQLILYLTLTILPIIVAIPMLFTDRLNYTDRDWEYIGVGNFVELFQDSSIRGTYLAAIGRTIRFTIMNYAMVFVFGLGLALLMYEIGFRGGFFSIIYLPYMLSGLALGFMAVMLFSESSGTMNLLLKELGLLRKPINIKAPSGTLVILPIIVGWRMAGFYLAIFLSGLLSIPVETVEAAIVDGASYWQRLILHHRDDLRPAQRLQCI
jgi:multiple sugar transport system permease protein